jgi:hypothetical protein
MSIYGRKWVNVFESVLKKFLTLLCNEKYVTFSVSQCAIRFVVNSISLVYQISAW